MKNFNNQGFAAVEGILIVIVIGIVGFTGWFVYHAKQNTDKTLTAAGNSTATQPTKKTTESTAPAAPQYISYGDVNKGTGIRIMTAADVAKLTAAGDKLKSYLSAHLAVACDPSNPLSSCTSGESDPQYIVASTYGDFAATQAQTHYAVLGPESASGEIKELLGGQEAPLCSDLAIIVTKNNIPSGFYLKDSVFNCFPTSNSSSPVPYASYKS